MNLKIQKIPVGISSCLMGNEVRYDGGHMRSEVCMQHLDAFCEWVPTCPEVAIGMPVPRPTIHLMETKNEIRLVDVASHTQDYTQQMQAYSHERLAQLSHLCGYIVAKGSPSCGMERIKIWGDKKQGDKNWQTLRRDGIGVFTQNLMQTYPCLPVEENGRLNDPMLRDNFIARLFIFYYWKQLVSKSLSYNALFNFNARVKYALMTSDVNTYKTLGREIAQASENKKNIQYVAQDYIERLMNALKKISSRSGHCNVLLHLMGYFKKDLNATEKKYLRESIDAYRLGVLPLGVPVSILKLHLENYPKPYLENQFYLFPYPQVLATRDFL